MAANNTTFTDQIINALKKAATELEELRLQASLGKAEAKDKFEDIKKKFNAYVHDAKTQIEKGKDKFDDLHQKLDELRVQLALGKAETVEEFEQQRKKVLAAIHDIETKIKGNPTLNQVYAILLIEIEKFKVQLEWLGEKIREGANEFESSFEDQKKTFNEFIQRMADKFSKEEPEEEKTRWEHFQSEVKSAFGHLKQAVQKP